MVTGKKKVKSFSQSDEEAVFLLLPQTNERQARGLAESGVPLLSLLSPKRVYMPAWPIRGETEINANVFDWLNGRVRQVGPITVPTCAT